MTSSAQYAKMSESVNYKKLLASMLREEADIVTNVCNSLLLYPDCPIIVENACGPIKIGLKIIFGDWMEEKEGEIVITYRE